MKVHRKIIETLEVNFIEVEAVVRYDEDDMPNDFPGRRGDLWIVRIVVDNGDLWVDGKRFPKDVSLDLHMKVCDTGTYRLFDMTDQVAEIRKDYVPSCFPGKHYGDYLMLDIRDGKVANWNTTPAKIEESFRLLGRG